MKKLSYILIALVFFACKDGKKTNSTENTEDKKEIEITKEVINEEEEALPIIVGTQTREAISSEPYDSWFAPTYATYPVDKETAEKVQPLMTDVSVKIFMGTWCEDSQREVPQFYKILDKMNISNDIITLITVDEDKTTPENLEEGLNITNVPTFIFYKDGKEINRIVESPVTSLEKDMLSILSGEDYTHIYAE
ncbi:thiol-disulfide isomerase/thioredoxin [Kordia periserrulae]|uniref:Thiol-disulfide isomerase/thioredoxin n=1 Tax=Kordia periserrulae TaxID=701523 RepID=A0A2T6C5C6_9FLAO|nr:thioredoxin family protein [Kordia periserrulae]PTX63534.1 thiol-disulfide isomerase/thioredoxin [Kordia periserrulae]